MRFIPVSRDKGVEWSSTLFYSMLIFLSEPCNASLCSLLVGVVVKITALFLSKFCVTDVIKNV